MPQSRVIMSREEALADGQKPTLKTIAKMSGLAVPTVSRALSDAPDIGQKTKDLVRGIAEDIGYVPNRAGVRLRTGRTNVISLVMSTEHDNNTARLMSGVAAGLQGTKFHLNVTPFSAQDDIMKPVRYIVETRSADAVILNQIEPEDPRIAYLMDKKLPFATHGRTNWAEKHAYFDYDNEAFARLAVEMLAKRGRRKILAVAPPTAQSYSQHILKGLKESCALHRLPYVVAGDITSDDEPQQIFEGVKRYLTKNEGFDSIILGSTSSALAATAAIEAIGLKVGQEIDVVSKDANQFLQIFRKEMLTLPESIATAGKFLALAVMQAIANPDLPPMQNLDVPTYDQSW